MFLTRVASLMCSGAQPVIAVMTLFVKYQAWCKATNRRCGLILQARLWNPLANVILAYFACFDLVPLGKLWTNRPHATDAHCEIHYSRKDGDCVSLLSRGTLVAGTRKQSFGSTQTLYKILGTCQFFTRYFLLQIVIGQCPLTIPIATSVRRKHVRG